MGSESSSLFAHELDRSLYREDSLESLNHSVSAPIADHVVASAIAFDGNMYDDDACGEEDEEIDREVSLFLGDPEVVILSIAPQSLLMYMRVCINQPQLSSGGEDVESGGSEVSVAMHELPLTKPSDQSSVSASTYGTISAHQTEGGQNSTI